MGTPCEEEMLEYLKEQFYKDRLALERGEEVSLLAKWLPSVNASNAQTVRRAKRIADAFGLSDAKYRKLLSALRARLRIIENNLREKDYTFDYAKQPSRAMFKYKKAFMRNDADRYKEFLVRVSKGEISMQAENMAPYELLAPYLKKEWGWKDRCFMRDISPEEERFLNAAWESLPDFGSDENAIAVIDTSGSMYCESKPIPAAVAISLGLYFAEHNKGIFKQHFIEFSTGPRLIEIKGESFVERLRYVCTFHEVANTNLEEVFNTILRAAVKNNIPQAELPAKLIIVSDMEFDACMHNASAVNFKNAEEKYAGYGYTLPEVIFWNVAGRNKYQTVKHNDRSVTLISGAIPGIFSMLAGGPFSPYKFMMEILEGERYAKIVA